MKKIKLNLGCGNIHKQGYINMDMVAPADIVEDVRNGIPFKDDNFDLVEADNLMEHFNPEEFMFVMNEIWRVLKPNGVFWFKVPDALHWMDGAFGDPTHKKFFVPRSFAYFTIGDQQFESYGKYYGFKGWKKIGLKTNNLFFEWSGTKIVN